MTFTGLGALQKPLPGCVSLFLFYPVGVRFPHRRLSPFALLVCSRPRARHRIETLERAG